MEVRVHHSVHSCASAVVRVRMSKRGGQFYQTVSLRLTTIYIYLVVVSFLNRAPFFLPPAPSMSSSAADGSRFTHLLQPIRCVHPPASHYTHRTRALSLIILTTVSGTSDLSQNWNIDLAQELEEYLDELEHLSIAFDPADDDGGGDGDSVSVGVATRAQQQRQALASQDARVMNFAEAALLIQGTSVIYSRKVEYLYALVFQTLAHLTRQQETPVAARGAEGSGDDAATGDDDHHGDDAHDVFANPLPVVDELDEARNITLKTVSAETQRQRSGGAAKSNTNIQCVL